MSLRGHRLIVALFIALLVMNAFAPIAGPFVRSFAGEIEQRVAPCTWPDPEKPFFHAEIVEVNGEQRIMFHGRACTRGCETFLGSFVQDDRGQTYEIKRVDGHGPTTFGATCWMTPGAHLALPPYETTLTVIANHEGRFKKPLQSIVWTFRYSGDPENPDLALVRVD